MGTYGVSLRFNEGTEALGAGATVELTIAPW